VADAGCSGCGMWLMWEAVADAGCCGWDVGLWLGCVWGYLDRDAAHKYFKLSWWQPWQPGLPLTAWRYSLVNEEQGTQIQEHVPNCNLLKC